MDVRRLLIATIGENDPASPHGPMAALRVALHDEPDLVILVHTCATLPQADETRRRIEADLEGAAVRLVALPNDDPTDAETMIAFLHQRWTELRREFARAIGRPPRSGDLDVFVCGSSGTREMGLALMFTAELAFPWAWHWTAHHPDSAPATATPPSRDPCLRPFGPGVFRHRHETREAFTQFAGCRFREAADRFEERVGSGLSPARIALTVACTLRDLADGDPAAALREFFAAPTLSESADRLEAPAPVAAWLGRLEAWFEPVRRALASPNDLGDPWPAELVSIALRERAAGRLRLAVTGMQTAFEVAMQIRLTQLGDRPARRERDWERMLNRLRDRDERLDGELSVPTSRLGAALRLVRACNDLDHRGRTQHDLEQVLADGHQLVDRLLCTFGWCSSADSPTTPAEIECHAALLAEWAGLPMEG